MRLHTYFAISWYDPRRKVPEGSQYTDSSLVAGPGWDAARQEWTIAIRHREGQMYLLSLPETDMIDSWLDQNLEIKRRPKHLPIGEAAWVHEWLHRAQCPRCKFLAILTAPHVTAGMAVKDGSPEARAAGSAARPVPEVRVAGKVPRTYDFQPKPVPRELFAKAADLWEGYVWARAEHGMMQSAYEERRPATGLYEALVQGGCLDGWGEPIGLEAVDSIPRVAFKSGFWGARCCWVHECKARFGEGGGPVYLDGRLVMEDPKVLKWLRADPRGRAQAWLQEYVASRPMPVVYPQERGKPSAGRAASMRSDTAGSSGYSGGVDSFLRDPGPHDRPDVGGIS